MPKDSEKEIKSIVARIEKLEQSVFGVEEEIIFTKKIQGDFSGATGGIRFLDFQKFFNGKRSLSDVRNELSGRGYHYSLQAVQTALNRLSKPGSPLVTFKEGGKKVYAKRK